MCLTDIYNNKPPIQTLLFYGLNIGGQDTTLKKELDNKQILSKKRISKRGKIIGGKPFSRGALYSILQNPIFIGKIRHKDQTYDGNHEAIISKELWQAVQEQLKTQSTTQRGHKKSNNENILKGLLFDNDNQPYTPHYTKKSGKHYRYYICPHLIKQVNHPNTGIARIPAHEIELLIISTINKNIIEVLALNQVEDCTIIQHINEHPLQTEKLIPSCVTSILITIDIIYINMNTAVLHRKLQQLLNLHIPKKYRRTSHQLTVPFTTRRSYKGAVILSPKTSVHDPFDIPSNQLKSLIRGIAWRDEHFAGVPMTEISKREGLSEAAIRKTIMASFDKLLTL